MPATPDDPHSSDHGGGDSPDRGDTPDVSPAALDPALLAEDVLENLNEARRGNAPEGAPGAFTTWYSALIGVVTFVAMFAAGAWSFVDPTTCSSILCTPGPARTGVVSALSLALAGLLAWAAAWVGPLGADPARLTWLHSSPASRSRLLRTRLLATYVITGIVGALVGAGAAVTLTSSTSIEVPTAGAWLGASASLLLVAVAVTAQPNPARHTLVRRVGAGTAGLGLSLAALGALVNGRDVADLAQVVGDATPSTPQVLAAGVILTLATAAVLPFGVAHLERLRRLDLRLGGEAFGALEASTLMMDGAATTELIASRRVAGHGRYASRRGRGAGVTAHLHRDVVRLSRRGDLAGLAVVAMLAPGLIGVVVHHAVALVLAAFLVSSLCRSAASGYSAWSRSSGLSRMYPQSSASLRVALLAGPAMGALAWSVGATTVAGLDWWLGAPLTCAALAAVLRAGRPVNRSGVGPLLSTPMGAIPLGLVAQLGGQVAIVLLCVGPFLVSTSPMGLSLPLAVVAYQASRAGSGGSSIFADLGSAPTQGTPPAQGPRKPRD